MIALKKATEADKETWFSIDPHIEETVFFRKCRDQYAYLITEDENTVGVLRFSLFWDAIPFLDLLFLTGENRRKNIGRAAMTLWEDKMRKSGYRTVLLSTQADEDAQHFYRKIGYTDCGCLLLNDGAHKQPTELFFKKELEG